MLFLYSSLCRSNKSIEGIDTTRTKIFSSSNFLATAMHKANSEPQVTNNAPGVPFGSNAIYAPFETPSKSVQSKTSRF